MIHRSVRPFILCAGFVASTCAIGARAWADPPKHCPDFTVACTMEYDPVICDDGNIYSNLCVATYFGCAEGCVSTGGGVVFLDGGGDQAASRLATAYEPVALGDDPSGYMLVPIRTDGGLLDGDAESTFLRGPGGGHGGGGSDCPRFDIVCTMEYDPVICDDGNVYSNLCVATYFGCATGCVPYGDGGPVPLSAQTDVDYGGVSVTPEGDTESTFLRRGGGGHGGGDGCPRYDIVCTMEYDPVICDDGNVYSNLCVATYFGCATGCVPYGDGGPVPLSGQASDSGDGSVPQATTGGTELSTVQQGTSR